MDGEPDPGGELEARIGYDFRDRAWLSAALTHTTYLNEHPQATSEHFLRLAFLGDAVIELAVRDLAMGGHPAARVGRLSTSADDTVRNTHLAATARRLGLGSCLILGRGEDNPVGRDRDIILADALEALAGAIYRDADDPTRALAVVRQIFAVAPGPAPASR